MTNYQVILQNELQKRRLKNPRFSLRAFARVLEISPSHLSSLMRGKKKLSLQQSVKMSKNLELTELENEILVQNLTSAISKKSIEFPDLQLLADDEFHLISDWYHLAILSLGRLKNKANTEWIATKLNIEPTTAKQALQRLLRLKLIEIKNNEFKQTTRPLTTSTDVPSLAIRKYHSQNLDLAAKKLEKVDVKKRDFSTITMAIHPRKMTLAKKMLNEFKQKFCVEIEDDSDPSEVYTLAMQFFPVTNTKELI